MRTLYLLDGRGRIRSTREPNPVPGPLFVLIRAAGGCAWAVHADVGGAVAAEVERLAGDEPPLGDLREAPLHAAEYLALLGGRAWSGPAFAFPEVLPDAAGVVRIEDEAQLGRHFHGWAPGEIAAGRAPVLAVIEDGAPVSVCFCARRTDRLAEAGLETAEAYRRRGHAVRVTAAWAMAVRATGRTPLYSTWWENAASLAVARRLGLRAYASDWSVVRG